MLTNVEFSLKSIVEDFYLDHGKVYQPDIPGALTGDQICTCLHCGEVEEGSAPFGLCVPLEDGDQSGD
jgi:hypothetical protein